MDCPHCHHSLRFWNLGLKNTCPSCDKKLSLSFNPFIIAAGIIVTFYVMDRLSPLLIREPYYLVIYFLVSFLSVALLSLRVIPWPGFLELIHVSIPHRMYFAVSLAMTLFIPVSICMLYIDKAPAIEILDQIEGTIFSIQKLGEAWHFTIMSEGYPKKYYVYGGKELETRCPGIADVKLRTRVKVLAENAPNLLDYYIIWEFANDTGTIVPYETTRAIGDKVTVEQMKLWGSIDLFLFLLFPIARYFKIKADEKMVMPESE